MRTVKRLLLSAACIGVLAAAVTAVGEPAGARTPAKTFAGQPAPTYIPSAPGISIATASFDLPDPFILKANGKYYMYLSSAYGNSNQNVPLLVGGPGHWRSSIDAVPQLPAWAIGDPGLNQLTWSPAVYRFGHHYVMYVALQIRGSDPTQHCIAIASSPSPTGPFAVSPTPFVCQGNLGGDIDPEVFVDPHGPDGRKRPYYFIWKSDNNSTPGDGIASIWAQPLSNDGSSLEGKPSLIFQPDETWQSTLVEAPQMALSPSKAVWMFFSAGQGYFAADYGMGAVRCAGPLGPCTHPLPGPLITTNDQGPGPGEETYFVGPDGSDWLLYSPVHTADAFELFRPVEAARIGWNAAGPYVADDGAFPSPGGCGARTSRAASRSHHCTRLADSGSR
jgi:arabinan endo-1,5-alpha-L-arabinosidase